jgi:trehalose 6-phosphate synthase
VATDGGGYGELVVVDDMSFVAAAQHDTKKYVLYLFAAIATVVALITVIIAEISWRGWNSRA